MSHYESFLIPYFFLSALAQWFGHYSWGHDGGKLYRNEVHDNYGYGFDPHDDSDKVEIIENVVYNNGWHGISECTHNRVYTMYPDIGFVSIIAPPEIRKT